MLKVAKRDYITITAVAAVLLVLFIISTRDKVRPVPADDKHRSFLEALRKGENRIAVEKRCLTCHSLQALFSSKKHPPKEQCLVCHKTG